MLITDRTYWTECYSLSRSSRGALFLGDVAARVFDGGKAVNLLGRIAPEHPLLTPNHHPPDLSVCLSREERAAARQRFAVHAARTAAMMKHTLSTRLVCRYQCFAVHAARTAAMMKHALSTRLVCGFQCFAVHAARTAAMTKHALSTRLVCRFQWFAMHAARTAALMKHALSTRLVCGFQCFAVHAARTAAMTKHALSTRLVCRFPYDFSCGNDETRITTAVKSLNGLSFR